MIFNARKSDFLVSAVIVVVSLSVADAAVSLSPYKNVQISVANNSLCGSFSALDVAEAIPRNYETVSNYMCTKIGSFHR